MTIRFCFLFCFVFFIFNGVRLSEIELLVLFLSFDKWPRGHKRAAFAKFASTAVQQMDIGFVCLYDL